MLLDSSLFTVPSSAGCRDQRVRPNQSGRSTASGREAAKRRAASLQVRSADSGESGFACTPSPAWSTKDQGVGEAMRRLLPVMHRSNIWAGGTSVDVVAFGGLDRFRYR